MFAISTVSSSRFFDNCLRISFPTICVPLQTQMLRDGDTSTSFGSRGPDCEVQEFIFGMTSITSLTKTSEFGSKCWPYGIYKHRSARIKN